jgi:hypothetical protein
MIFIGDLFEDENFREQILEMANKEKHEIIGNN